MSAPTVIPPERTAPTAIPLERWMGDPADDPTPACEGSLEQLPPEPPSAARLALLAFALSFAITLLLGGLLLWGLS